MTTRAERIAEWKRIAAHRKGQVTFVCPETGEKFTFEGGAIVAYDAGVTSGTGPRLMS